MTEIEMAREYLEYCPETGEFHWKKASSDKSKVGSRAGRPRSPNGYWLLTLMGKTYYVHRLAWFFVHGVMPGNQVDHINGVKGDNRIANLRNATQSQNLANIPAKRDNTSGAKNVHWCNTRRVWVAKVKRDGKTRHAGDFHDYESAVVAANLARVAIHGEFANHGGRPA